MDKVDGSTLQACFDDNKIATDELTDLGFDQIFRKKLEVKLKVA